MRTIQNRYKYYVDNRKRPWKFEIVDKIFLIVTLMKKVMRFRKKDKLSP